MNFTRRRTMRVGMAAGLAAVAPAGLSRVFFTNSGSESVDTESF